MTHFVCLLEEESAKALLVVVLPRILPKAVVPFYIVFEGKQDLEKQLVRKIRNWQNPDSVFLVMRDQDSSACTEVKERLNRLCRETGKHSILVRIACRELESFYFGDLPAVKKGLGITNLSRSAVKAKYRVPDEIVNPSDELEKLTCGKYQHISGSRSIAPHLSLTRNTSKSFNVLVTGIQRFFQKETQ